MFYKVFCHGFCDLFLFLDFFFWANNSLACDRSYGTHTFACIKRQECNQQQKKIENVALMALELYPFRT